MAEYSSEKRASATGRDYEGLELDTRAGDGADKYLDHSKPLPDLRKWQEEEENRRYLNEKQMIQAHEVPQSSPTSPDSSMGALSPQSPYPKGLNDCMGSPPEPRIRRICGLRRGLFWLMFGIVLALVIVAAVVGGVVGGTRHSSKSSPGQESSPTVPAAGNVPVDPGDVVGGSPLNVISYSGKGSGSPKSQQIFRVYYQSVLGNIKEAVSNGLDSWAAATPIFTDAVNNTGLATVTYTNGSAPTGQMFYIGTNGYIQEKRKAFSDPLYWEPGSLNRINIKAVGNITLPKTSQNLDSINQFGSFRMAAVYSENFVTGPETRLFHHKPSSNGTNWVQEWIWTKKTDDWRIGQAIPNVYPNSHIAATVDEQNKLLRLYFSSGNLTLQEMWLNITDFNGLYNNGFTLKKFLPQNDADLAATSDNGTIYLYHPSNIGEIGVRELIISGVPNGGLFQNAPQESYNLSESLVAKPSLTSIEGTSPHSPIAASMTRVQDPKFSDSVFVFWADRVTGSKPSNVGSVTGYRSLQQVSRQLRNAAWTTSDQMSIPLGGSNTFPDTSSKRRRWYGWV
ncbi:MAG: hypothetical protein Q9166_006391 [cf. Caloplaca sp. 2 TL-2023]